MKIAITPGAFLAFSRIDVLDNGMGVRRAHERRIGLAGQRDVVGVLTGAGEEAVVLLALDARADQGRRGGGIHNLPPIALAPATMLFTML